MYCNNQAKKQAAFYHNQQLDYDRWLMDNTRNQQRQRWIAPAKTRKALATILAMSAGFAQIY
ncbi:hypothetical protein S349_12 [Shewanella sp. phage 3/49]|uniref:hypothetical protein n=1 Tax=Shewanella sp. phage 3/49 TaxID=1458863 RepID=UPI0004F90BC6|nr:hypothetical protein S349_12 [Shewanella sp. phage 3/49]AHK11802.1 hypothetical protein S349_12 [Shewanella sp. phage 3/49]